MNELKALVAEHRDDTDTILQVARLVLPDKICAIGHSSDGRTTHLVVAGKELARDSATLKYVIQPMLDPKFDYLKGLHVQADRAHIYFGKRSANHVHQRKLVGALVNTASKMANGEPMRFRFATPEVEKGAFQTHLFDGKLYLSPINTHLTVLVGNGHAVYAWAGTLRATSPCDRQSYLLESLSGKEVAWMKMIASDVLEVAFSRGRVRFIIKEDGARIVLDESRVSKAMRQALAGSNS